MDISTYPADVLKSKVVISPSLMTFPSQNAQLQHDAPPGVLLIRNYLSVETCRQICAYADSIAPDILGVYTIEKQNTQSDERVTQNVHIDGMVFPLVTIFTDIYCNQVAPFYHVDFEWFERPQLLRYPPGGKYNRHADAEHQDAQGNWRRALSRDYSVILYLNDDFAGGELEMVNQQLTIQPEPGMLLAFPSDRGFLHAVLPTTSGVRYALVSWAAVMGSARVTEMPYVSVVLQQKKYGT
jgi:predicted 2-oxoglutarate/Fe(II)-dependent dioxygenase YbiX